MRTSEILGYSGAGEKSHFDKQGSPERSDLNKLKIDVEEKGLYGEYDKSIQVKGFVLKEKPDDYYLKVAYLLLLHCLSTNQKVFAVFHKFKEENAKKSALDKTKINPEGITIMSHMLRRNKIGELNKGKPSPNRKKG